MKDDNRILLVDYSYQQSSILSISFNPGIINLDFRWHFENTPIEEVYKIVEYFATQNVEVLMSQHEPLNQLVPSARIVDLSLLSEKELSQLDDLFLSIKHRVKKYDDSIVTSEDSDINCLKMLVYQYRKEFTNELRNYKYV
jgi:hypothetical protein